VTTIDQYAEERGLIPSIIDGATDRLRPVMLTTLTTVLGLAPLLYEQSQQAQFLKPTVITLVYGLGFGMILVLLVVPSLVAVQHDIGRPLIALRRALRSPDRLLRGLVWATSGLMSVWLAVTLGAALIWGDLPAVLTERIAVLQGADPLRSALVLFLPGAFLIVGFGFLVSALAYARAAARRA
jgi:hypothetical protein